MGTASTATPTVLKAAYAVLDAWSQQVLLGPLAGEPRATLPVPNARVHTLTPLTLAA